MNDWGKDRRAPPRLQIVSRVKTNKHRDNRSNGHPGEEPAIPSQLIDGDLSRYGWRGCVHCENGASVYGACREKHLSCLAARNFPHATVSIVRMDTPSLEVQRAAMMKLAFLVGKWAAGASVLRGGQLMDLSQTEEAQFKLHGLILMIEGVGRSKSDGTAILQALGFISFDDASGKYRMRAFNEGRWLETEVELLDNGNSITWGFCLGKMRTHSVLHINEKGEWVVEFWGQTRNVM